ncbi:MAG TPA: gliding motility-associated C-terminal domain-containing protein, partial [Flavobacteriales bacterium]|nr:gliding motility-associated C-terminal domain-containing protein [Flavobacteriales bacterium]
AGSDGSWGGMAHWRTTSGNWNDMSTMTLGTAGIFSTVTRPTWLFANPGHPYVLTNVRPATPVINCPTICENTFGNTFTLTGSSSSYTWTVPANGTIVSGQGTSSVTVDWTTGTGSVSVIAVGTAGCNSLPADCTPTVVAQPVAGFSVEPDGTFGDSWQFTDTSAGAVSWNWAFGDGNTATTQNPLYQYSDAGTYTIVLTVSNGTCSDTASITIDANGGVIVPNVFSPNGDGFNDSWYILTGTLSEYNLQIFNRWGQLMFESADISQQWTGDFNGKPCVEGTYYYVLKAKTDLKDYSQTGALLLVRQ